MSARSSSSELSLDSLEVDRRQKATRGNTSTAGNTILVPFYEKDVLVKIEKPPMKNKKHNKNKADNRKTETEAKSYLVNKNTDKQRKPSYLEAFRRKFPPDFTQNRNVEDIRSLSPEFGDTERDSFSENEVSPRNDFYETEAYNDIYYDKMMNQELEDALNRNLEQAHLTEDKPFNEYIINNLKSISELTQPRRRSRRASVEPVHNIRLGGLGPDLENIKPRLERAKSLQRYSETIRMKNRLKIYKKSVQEDANIKKEFERIQKTDLTDVAVQKENEPSYLVNRSLPGRKTMQLKSKSANARNGRSGNCQVGGQSEETNNNTPSFKKALIVRGTSAPKNIKTKLTEQRQKKQDDKDRSVDMKEVPEGTRNAPNFDALKSLEEKHRMYQEKVKQFQMFYQPDF